MEANNDQLQRAISDEALESVAGGVIDLDSYHMQDLIFPMLEHGMNADQIYDQLIKDGVIKEGERYWVPGNDLFLGAFINDLWCVYHYGPNYDVYDPRDYD